MSYEFSTCSTMDSTGRTPSIEDNNRDYGHPFHYNKFWCAETEAQLAFALHEFSKPHPILDCTHMWKVMKQAGVFMSKTFVNDITPDMIRARVGVLRERFIKFRRYMSIPGVNFDPHSDSVRTDELYAEYEHKETLLDFYFKVHGMPNYFELDYFFNVKRAPLTRVEEIGSSSTPYEIFEEASTTLQLSST